MYSLGWHFFVSWITLLVLGILGAASVIIKKKPEAKELIDKLRKISGYVGILSILWGIWNFFDMFHFFRSGNLLYLLTMLAMTVVFLGLGTIFGFELAAGYLSEEARGKGETFRDKLLTYQIPLGYLSLGLFVWLLFFRWTL